METEKIGFFKRVKLSIFNLEKYSIFTNEKFSKALKYLAILVLIITVFLAASSTIELSQEAGKLIEFVKSKEFPNFELKDGKLEADKILTSYDEEYNASLIVDTNKEITNEKIEEYKKMVKNNNYSVILLNDKIIYDFGTSDSSLNNGLETTYNNITSMFGIKDTNKDKFVKDYLNSDNLFKVKSVLFIYAFLTILILNILNLLEDIIIIGLFGWIASKIAKVPLTLSKNMILAIYSLTLSIILSALYSIVYSFTNFEIKYFELMYMIIAYIYIVAAIMIMKEGNRTASDVVTVEGQVLKAEDSNDEDEQNEKEDKKDKNKEEPKDKNEEIPENKEKNIEESNEGKE